MTKYIKFAKSILGTSNALDVVIGIIVLLIFTAVISYIMSRRFRERVARFRVMARCEQAIDSKLGLVFTITICLLVLYSPLRAPNFLGLSSYSAVWILAGFAAVATALMAVVFALMVFRAETLLRRLPLDLARRIPREAWVSPTLSRLTIVLLSSLLGLAPIDENAMSPNTVGIILFNLTLLAGTVIILLSAPPYPFGVSFAQVVSRHCSRPLTPRYFRRRRSPREGGVAPAYASGVLTDTVDPFALVEQVAVKAMSDGDLTTCVLLLKSVVDRVMSFVENPEEGKKREALNWIGELLLTVGSRALLTERRIAILAIDIGYNIVADSHHLSLPWTDRIELLSHLHALRRHAIHQSQEDVAQQAFYIQGRAFAEAIKFAPGEQVLSSLFADDESRPEHSSAAELEWNQLWSEYVISISGDLRALRRMSLGSAYSSALLTLSLMMSAVLSSENLGDRQKRALLQRILAAMGRGIVDALVDGMEEQHLAWTPDLYIESVDRRGLNDLGDEICITMGNLVVEGARCCNLPRVILDRVTANGRRYASEANDGRACIIVDALKHVGVLLSRQKSKAAQRIYLDALKSLESISKWDKRPESDLKRKIKKAISENFPDRVSRLEKWDRENEWRSETPGSQ